MYNALTLLKLHGSSAAGIPWAQPCRVEGCTIRFAATTKVLAKCILKYYRVS